MIEKNISRTVKLTLSDENFYKDDDYAEPGLSVYLYENHLSFACPGCGRKGSIPIGVVKPPSPGWQITEGSVDDLTTLTLSPSIHCIGCCGWHGHLIRGVYKSV